MSKSGTYILNTDLQFWELYYEVFWYKQLKFRNILFVRLVSVVVWTQQSSKNAMLNSQISSEKDE